MSDAPLTWSVDGIAVALDVHPGWLRGNVARLIREHGFPPALPGLGPRCRRWDRQAVFEWLAVQRGARPAHQVASPAPTETDYAAVLDQRAEQLGAELAARARPGRRACPPSRSAT